MIGSAHVAHTKPFCSGQLAGVQRSGRSLTLRMHRSALSRASAIRIPRGERQVWIPARLSRFNDRFKEGALHRREANR